MRAPQFELSIVATARLFAGLMFAACLFRAYVDARIQTIYGGTNEIMKELIARNIVSKM